MAIPLIVFQNVKNITVWPMKSGYAGKASRFDARDGAGAVAKSAARHGLAVPGRTQS